MSSFFAPHAKDSYKIGHIDQYPDGTTEIYSNFTARSGTHSNVPDSKGIYFVGLQYFILDYLIDEWETTFFSQNKDAVVKKYERRVSHILGYTVEVDHIAALHDIGYLPIEIKALPEGSFVKYGVPMLTIKNTLPEFYWVTNMLESVLSAELWQPITSATTYMAYKEILCRYAAITGADQSFVQFQAHDFSFRGMAGRHAAAISGFAVLAAGGSGTDNILAIDIAEDYYDANVDTELVGVSVNATEHSVMCAGSKETEYDTYVRLITEIYPTGIISIVSDTWDFWTVVTEYLPRMKDIILNRAGKVVIRPDSGDPVRIICGDDIEVIKVGTDPENIERAKRWACDTLTDEVQYNAGHGECGAVQNAGIFKWGDTFYLATIAVDWNRYDKQYYYITESNIVYFEEVNLLPEQKGLIECLWETFGGKINDSGYKELHGNIGAIYGDSITIERAAEIMRRLEVKGFASTNIVLGVGSYTYQMNTRDTHGMAMKSTNAVINGVQTPIFKDPITDNGVKKSAKGLLMVTWDVEGYKLQDMVDTKAEKRGCLETVFRDGVLIRRTTLKEIRQRMAI